MKSRRAAAISNRGSVLKKHHKIKLIAASVALMSSFSAMAGLGGLNVQSNLGEPFVGTITVSGEEAKALLNGGKAAVSNGNLRAGVRKSGDKAVITLRSSKPINDPVLIFQVGVGAQSREYTAIIDPAGYGSKSARVQESAPQARTETVQDAPVSQDRPAERVRRAVREDAETGRQAVAKQKAEKEKKAAQAKAKAQQAASGIRYGSQHVVRQGETLNGIAARIRPQGMSVAQTAAALMQANPAVFVNNDANLMLAGKVLNIPERAALQSSNGVMPQTTETPDANTTPATQPTMPSETATAPVAPAETPASTPASAPVQDIAASAVAASAASVPDAAASVEAPASAAQPAETPAIAQPAEQASEEGGMWPWLLLGGAGLLAALLALKLFGGKRKEEEFEPVPEEVELEKETEFSAENFDVSAYNQDSAFTPKAEVSNSDASFGKAAVAAGAVAATAAVAAAAKPEEEGLAVEDDFDDDVFFTEVEEAPAKQENFGFDVNALDNSQGGIVSSAVTTDEETEKRRDADWDNIESTESVYEPEPENPYAQFQAAAEALAEAVAEEKEWDFFADSTEEKAAEAADVAVNEQAADEETAEAEEAWDFFTDEKAEAAEPEAVQVETVAFEPETVEEVQAAAEDEALDFYAPFEAAADQTSEVVAQVAETAADVKEAAESADFSWAGPAAAAAATATAAASALAFGNEREEVQAEDTIEFEAAEFETAAPAAAIEVETAEIQDLDAPLAFEAYGVSEQTVATVAESVSADAEAKPEPELFEVKQDEEVRFQVGDDVAAEEEIAAIHTIEQADEAIEWESLSVADTAGSRSESGFISESVGMTAPLEAKYELAKMYVEIGDPEAARETLQELLEESDGGILAKAKAMLEELDA